MESRIEYLRRTTGFLSTSQLSIDLAKKDLTNASKEYYLSDASDGYRFESQILLRYNLDFSVIYNACYNNELEIFDLE